MELNKLYRGDCLDIIKTLPENSIDSIITDPPYELGFMGKSWDNTGIANNKELWAECLRVLKPGGHLLAFSGTRTYHRMACAIEDAGFEVRDMIEWVYGSGFPKSLNIGKAIDKIAPRLGQFDEFAKHLSEKIKTSGKTQKEIASLFPSKTGGLTGCVWNWCNGANVPTIAQWKILKPLLDLSDDFLPLIERIEREREFLGKYETDMGGLGGERLGVSGGNITKGTSEWEGWGTALKPAHEPICMARKPLAEKTVAENVLKYGTGGINIDESRVDVADSEKEHFEKEWNRDQSMSAELGGVAMNKGLKAISLRDNVPSGRFPANIIHDNSEEVRECFPETKSQSGGNRGKTQIWGNADGEQERNGFNDSGNASRFFKSIIYQAKASKSERNKGLEDFETKQSVGGGGGIGDYLNDVNSASGKFGSEKAPAKNNHPTVKPIALMEYLIKMMTREGQIVLDPFGGSGTTGVACKNTNRNYILIEKDEGYCEIIEKRLSHPILPVEPYYIGKISVRDAKKLPEIAHGMIIEDGVEVGSIDDYFSKKQ